MNDYIEDEDLENFSPNSPSKVRSALPCPARTVIRHPTTLTPPPQTLRDADAWTGSLFHDCASVVAEPSGEVPSRARHLFDTPQATTGPVDRQKPTTLQREKDDYASTETVRENALHADSSRGVDAPTLPETSRLVSSVPVATRCAQPFSTESS